MDFGVPGLDCNTGPENGKLVGSLLRFNSLISADSGQQEHMLSFSSLKSEVPLISKDGNYLEISTQNSDFSSYQHSPSTYTRNEGYGSGSLNANMHGAFNGVRGPFTPSQWIELEHQALIYKYITSNVSVPSNLLIPLKKSLYPYGFTTSSAGSLYPYGFTTSSAGSLYPYGFTTSSAGSLYPYGFTTSSAGSLYPYGFTTSSAGSLPPSSLGWGSFHLGYSGRTDPEPGRCRRTDGKKWRCSRDAVADQKYCERHINRGRHRSRKPVEGQTGHAASGTSKPKVVPMSSPMSASVITGGSASGSLVIAQQQQLKNLQSGATNHSPDNLPNRIQDPRALSVVPSTSTLKSNNSTFTITKQGVPYAESSQSDFGHVFFDSLVNLSHRSSNMDSKEYSSFLDFTTDQETQDQNLLRRFINEWPKDESIRSVSNWPGELTSDWTQLSMSIPMTSSEFSSSSSSPAQEKLALSPLRSSREFDPIQMGSVVNRDTSHSNQNEAHWIQISWGSSMGGPLGEVLTNTTSNAGSSKNSSALSLLSEGWSGSPHTQSSFPTGVLQMAPFGSFSNSSSGSSPISENKKPRDGSSLCDDLFGSTLVSSALIPSVVRS